MLLIKFLANLSLMNAGHTFLSSSNGQLGVMVITPLELYAMGILRSESGVQQGNALGPLLLLGSP